MLKEISETFKQADFPMTLRLMDKHFGASSYSLKSLFRDERREILKLILGSTLDEADAAYRQLYEYHAPMMRFLKDVGMPAPRVLYSAAEVTLNNSLRRAFGDEAFDTELIKNLLEEANLEGISLETDSLEYALRRTLERIAEQFSDKPTELPSLEKLRKALDLLPLLPFQVNLWKIQNIYYNLLTTIFPEYRERTKQADGEAKRWVDHFTHLGKDLNIRVP